MPIDDELRSELEPFLEANLITEVLAPVKRGKEAIVFVCRAGPSQGAEWLAAKVHRPRDHRTFRNDACYQEGRWRRENSFARGFRAKSRFGREVQAAAWVEHEWKTLRALHRAGVSVPRPLERSGSAILMEFLGDDGAPAPMLRAVSLAPRAAQAALSELLAGIERMLALNVVHGDLSAYNVLWWRGRPRIIDVPQAVDPRLNPNGERLLARDVQNVCRACARWGAASDPGTVTADLWSRFRDGRL